MLLNESLIDSRRLSDIRSVSIRHGVEVYQANDSGHKVAIKLFSKDKKDNYQHENNILQQLSKKNSKVPKLLEFGEKKGTSFLITEWWEGEPLSHTFHNLGYQNKLETLVSLGGLLGELQFDLNYNDLATSDFWKRSADDRIDTYTWVNYVEKIVAKCTKRLRLTEEDLLDGIDVIVDQIITEASQMNEPNQITLLHTDYTLRNILTRDCEFLIIDFESVMIGDPMYDLAKMTWVDFGVEERPFIDAFVEGWERQTKVKVDLALLTFYQLVYCLASISWVDKLPNPNDDNLLFRNKARSTMKYLFNKSRCNKMTCSHES
ncbi:hypothetical protein PA598K_04531 [Paenibacillus sp. 598K]|uniref:phosphotransferase family protein n=1 Tax=Paenibacillus sp. 598K TaxID=1117987 RepID=UPI000FFA6BEA|nr:aminoglycoside phosphotransferase family protein [Paenibacillus sp. 598K]GBF76088.1 hypothetical protein PA598K_04531 [Paenibacillus sp. 598K]